MSLLIERPEELEQTRLAGIVSNGKQYLILGKVSEERGDELVLDALNEAYGERGEEIHHKELLEYTKKKYNGKYNFTISMLHDSLDRLKTNDKIEEMSKRVGGALKTFYRPKE